MAIEVLQSLIDKQDGFEIVRDQIAQILADEIANQMSLASGAGEDPTLWKLRIYAERSIPWPQYQERFQDDESPVVNVWFESDTFDGTKGNVISRQQAQGRFNIDIVSIGVSKEKAGSGHDAGDKQASDNLDRSIRLVRNILMASINTYLQLRGTVGKRWVESITKYEPEEFNNSRNLRSARFTLSVDFNETAPQYEGQALEGIHVDLKRAEDGQVIAQMQYDFTP